MWTGSRSPGEAALDTAEQCFDYCSELLLCHAVRRPPFSVDLFKLHEVTLILEHVNNTYIRNYALYKYIFTPQESGGTEAVAEPLASQEPCTENQETPPQNAGPAQAAPGPSRSALSQVIQEALVQEVLRVSGHPDQSLKSESKQHSQPQEKL
ncbi:hypothetical protein CRUP_025815 [Coryphaenoides rupestris]|nr:hypothetical protein CRUP_025815 [Coryphaenoides rupestris]